MLFFSVAVFAARGNSAADEEAIAKCLGSVEKLPAYMVYGKGIADSAAESRAMALQEIAQSISVSVKSEVSFSVVDDGKNLTRNDRSQASLVSQVDLNSVVEVCSVTDGRGRHYRVFAIDSRPPLQQVVHKMLDLWGGIKPGRIDWRGHKVLTGSRAVSELNSRLTDPAGKNTVTVSVMLDYYRNSWILSLDRITQTIRHQDVTSFLSFPFSDEHLKLIDAKSRREVAENQLAEGQEFFFNVQLTPGNYFQVVNIYEDGRVSVLEGLRRTAEINRVPEKGVFEAVLLEKGKPTNDIYLLLSSTERFRLPPLEQLVAWGGKLEGESAYQLDALLAWLSERQGNINMNSIEVLTRPGFF